MKEITILITGESIACNSPSGECMFKGRKDTVSLPVSEINNTDGVDKPVKICQVAIGEDMVSCYRKPPEPDILHTFHMRSPTEKLATVVLVDIVDTQSVESGYKLASSRINHNEEVIVGLLNTEIQNASVFKSVINDLIRIGPMLLPIEVKNPDDMEMMLTVLCNMLAVRENS